MSERAAGPPKFLTTAKADTAAPPPARILVTGSRRYGLEWHVRQVLDAELEHHGAILVVHGDNGSRRGADYYARCWAEDAEDAGKPARHEPHPANWRGPCRPECQPGHRKQLAGRYWYCPAAGIYRNQEMVDLGAVACHAFYAAGMAGQGGTGDCARRAAAAWIPVTPWEAGIRIT